MACKLFLLVVCVLLAECLAAPQREDGEQRITPQQRQRLQQQQQQQERQSQPRKINAVEQGQVLSLGTLATRDGSDAEMRRFLQDEEAVTAMTQCFITPAECSSRQDLKIVKQIRGLGPGGACKSCTKEETEKLHDRIYEFIEYYITRYPQLWRRVIPHLGSLITFVPIMK